MILLSIIIPTKNRYSCLFPVIEAITKYVQRQDMEIVIQDNSDDNSLAIEYFDKINDDRCRYFYVKESISISDNTLLALKNVSGKYVTFIGDDDLVSPYIMNVVDRMNILNIEALTFNCGYYWWNTVDFEKENYYKRKKAFWIPDNISSDFIEKQSLPEMHKLLNNGGTGIFELPRFYHGIVTKDVLDRIYRQVGTYLIGSCPDISFATSIAFVVDKYYYINYPVTIYGASKNSGGGWSASNKHYGKIEDQFFLKDNILDVWDDKIPRIWSAQTIYAETVSEVLRGFGILERLNYSAFYASMLVYEPFLFKYLKPLLVIHFRKNRREILVFLKIVFRKLLGRLYRNIKFRSKKCGFEVVLAQNVDECMGKLLNYKL